MHSQIEQRSLRNWLNGVMLVVWMSLIFYFSHQPDPPAPGVDNYLIRKLGHVGEFLILFGLWLRALRCAYDGGMRPVARLALLLTIAYAISDEAHQTFIAGRHGALVDVLIDSAAPSLLWLYYEKSAQHGHNTSA